MFYRQISADIKLSLTIPQYADALFSLTQKNRAYLKQWLPWLDKVQKSSDTRSFIQLQLLRFQKSEALHETIFYKDEIAGVLGYNQIDQENGVGHIGYWLGEQYNGKGIMTSSVKDLVKLGFAYFSVQRIEIRCAVDNVKSRAIPERLGFQNEGVIRSAEKVYDKYVDHAVYGLLKSEFDTF